MIEQRTEEWLKERSGKFTGSRFADAMACNKRTGEPLQSFYDLVWDVVAERIMGAPKEGPTGIALQWGTDVEPYAKEAYEFNSGNIVEQCGFILHKEYDFVGCSPDGLVGSDGGIEIKCPKDSTIHLRRFIDGVPEKYIPQCQGFLWVTGREWIDFASYDPRMPDDHRLLIIRITRNDEFIKRLESRILEAEAMVNDLVNRIKAYTA